RLGSNSMLVRATLEAGEHFAVNERRQIFDSLFRCPQWIAHNTACQDKAATRAAQRLVRGGGNDMKPEIKRIIGYTRSNQAGNVRHVGHQHCTHFVAYGSKFGVVQLARITAKARQNDLWPGL